jgi:hypothetical protein
VTSSEASDPRERHEAGLAAEIPAHAERQVAGEAVGDAVVAGHRVGAGGAAAGGPAAEGERHAAVEPVVLGEPVQVAPADPHAAGGRAAAADRADLGRQRDLRRAVGAAAGALVGQGRRCGCDQDTDPRGAHVREARPPGRPPRQFSAASAPARGAGE